MDSLVFSYGFTIGLTVIILLLNLILAINKYETKLNYSIVAVATGMLFYFCGHLLIYFGENVSEIIFGSTVLNISILVITIAFLFFSYNYVKSINKIYIIILSMLAILLIIVTFSRPYGMMFNELDINYQFHGFWSKEYAALPGVKSVWQDILLSYSVLYLVFIIYVAVKIFNENRYSEAFQYVSSVLLVIIAILIDGYIINFHEELAFVFILIFMSFRLFNKLVNAVNVEEALAHSEDKYKRLYQNSAFGIYQSSLDGKLLLINPAGREILGISSDEDIDVINDTDSLYKDKKGRDYFKKILLQNGSIYNFETELRKKDGKIIFVREYAKLFKNDSGKIIIEGAFEDISEKKHGENLLIEAKEAAEKSNNLKSEFLAQMSHEIRTPINTILNFSGLLKSDWEDRNYEDSEEYFTAISNSSKRITRTIDLILNMSQIQTGTYEPQFKFVDLDDDVLKLLFNEFKPEAAEKNIKLSFSEDLFDTIVWGDDYTITQIFTNLIDNAIKYTDEGEIKVYLEKNDKYLSVIIEDTGIGISDEYQKNIFEPFTQEQQGYTRGYDGNGLGLALVHKYCLLNNAKIEVESQEGKGSKFNVKFFLKNNI